MARLRDPKTGRFVAGRASNIPEAMQNPEAISANYSRAEQVKEFNRLRRIAKRRAKAVEASEWALDPISGAKSASLANLEQLASVKSVTNLPDGVLPAAISELARRLDERTLSVSGLNARRAQAVETLHRRYKGLEFITEKNWREFGQFMEYAREQHLGRMYDSERVAKWWADNHESGKDIEHEFYIWLERETRPEAPLHSREGLSGSGVFRA